MIKQPLLSPEEAQRVKVAVEKAEGLTSGEIVPVIVPESSDYAEVTWKSLLLGLLLGLLTYEIYSLISPGWDVTSGYQLVSLPSFLIIGAGLGYVAATKWAFFKRLLISNNRLDEAVHQRAKEAFLENEVFLTRDRTGMILLVSLFEHRVEVLGDSGINANVTENDWSDIVAVVIQGVKQGKLTDGLVAGIEQCGLLLQKLGLERKADDTNELPNAPQF